MSTGSVI
ncbi:unnamed protein product, partial [Allacma fusca]